MDKVLNFILSVGFEYKQIYCTEYVNGYILHNNSVCYLIELYKNENIIYFSSYGKDLLRTGGVDWNNVTEDDIDNIIEYIKNLNGVKQTLRKNKLQILLK